MIAAFKWACGWLGCLLMAGAAAAFDLVPQTDFLNDSTRGVAQIQQDGGDNLAHIDQTVGTLDLNHNAHFAEIIQSGSGNSAYILQTGNLNLASVTQTGKNNYATTDQAGIGNTISVSQGGDYSTVTATQYGNLNSILVTQPGGNLSTLTEIGNNNTIELHQTSGTPDKLNTYNITLTGNNMTMKVNQ